MIRWGFLGTCCIYLYVDICGFYWPRAGGGKSQKPSGEDDPGALPVTELCSVTAVYPVDRLCTRSTGYTAPGVDRMGTRSTWFPVHAVDRVNCREDFFGFFSFFFLLFEDLKGDLGEPF